MNLSPIDLCLLIGAVVVIGRAVSAEPQAPPRQIQQDVLTLLDAAASSLSSAEIISTLQACGLVERDVRQQITYLREDGLVSLSGGRYNITLAGEYHLRDIISYGRGGAT